MKKVFRLILVMALFVLCAGVLSACQTDKNNVVINYGYYYYSTSSDSTETSVIDTGVWMRYNEDKTWLSSDGYRGTYDIDGDTVIARQNGYSSYMRSVYSNGVMSVFGTTAYLVQNEAADRSTDVSLSYFTAISTIDQLMAIDDSESAASKSYYLTTDLDFEFYISTTHEDGSATWQGYGPTEALFATTSYAFSGILDGCGHKISNMDISATRTGDKSYSRGLLAKTEGATIRNLTLEYFEVDAVAGTPQPFALLIGKATATRLYDVYASGNLNLNGSGSYTVGKYCVGGLVGECEDGEIVRCKVTAIDTEEGENDGFAVSNNLYPQMVIGGLVGLATGNTSVDEGYFTGKMTVELNYGDYSARVDDMECDVASIIGRYEPVGDKTQFQIRNCGSDATIVALGNNTCQLDNDAMKIYIGGIVGVIPSSVNVSNLTFINCSFTGSLTGVGLSSQGSMTMNVGGICAFTQATITNCFFSGTSNSYIFIDGVRTGLSGQAATLTVAGICYNSPLTGCFVDGFMEGKITTAQSGATIRSANCTLNVVMLSGMALVNACKYSEDIVLNAYIDLNGAEIANVGTAKEMRDSRASDIVSGLPAENVEQVVKIEDIKLLYKMGYTPYRNVVDVYQNPSNTWTLTADTLPKLYWL